LEERLNLFLKILICDNHLPSSLEDRLLYVTHQFFFYDPLLNCYLEVVPTANSLSYRLRVGGLIFSLEDGQCIPHEAFFRSASAMAFHIPLYLHPVHSSWLRFILETLQVVEENKPETFSEDFACIKRIVDDFIYQQRESHSFLSQMENLAHLIEEYNSSHQEFSDDSTSQHDNQVLQQQGVVDHLSEDFVLKCIEVLSLQQPTSLITKNYLERIKFDSTHQVLPVEFGKTAEDVLDFFESPCYQALINDNLDYAIASAKFFLQQQQPPKCPRLLKLHTEFCVNFLDNFQSGSFFRTKKHENRNDKQSYDV